MYSNRMHSLRVIVLCIFVATCLAEEMPLGREELTRVAMDVATQSEDAMVTQGPEPREELPQEEEGAEPEKLRIYIVPHTQRSRVPQRPVVPLPLTRFNTPFLGTPYPRPFAQPLVVPTDQNLFRTHFPQAPSEVKTEGDLVMEHPLARVVYLNTPTYSPHYVYDPLQGQVTQSQYFIDKKSCLNTPVAAFCLTKPVLNI
ncbi:uncharacterized protein LOC122258774 [Penaeus japonicus]|uniref:uncharacterized protein LOC122258774 n=1 Tax=Penaeus japonicus TaxID=27405 RepID=UPI001C716D25|nr:uncharacterized protein LOC122258774 [Penaeus japonicus]